MKRVVLIHEASGRVVVLVEDDADVEVLLVDEAEPLKTRAQRLAMRHTADEIDAALGNANLRKPRPADAPVHLPSPEDELWVNEPMLSDHARLRYLQRVKGWDVAVADREILTKDHRALIRAGASAIHMGGWRLPIAQPGGRIKTVIPREPKHPPNRQGLYGRPEPKRASGRRKADFGEDRP